jgi:hypothetical protein
MTGFQFDFVDIKKNFDLPGLGWLPTIGANIKFKRIFY